MSDFEMTEVCSSSNNTTPRAASEPIDGDGELTSHSTPRSPFQSANDNDGGLQQPGSGVRGMETIDFNRSPVSPSSEAPPEKRKCLGSAITIWGWIFDVLTVLISLTDVVSDIMVAIQFFSDGETTWGWLVLSSLMLSNIVYTIFMCEIPLGSQAHSSTQPQCLNRLTEFPRVIKYLLVFPFAQLTPTLHWLREQFWPSTHLFRPRKRRWDGDDVVVRTSANQGAAAAVKEEAEAIANEAEVMKRLEGALEEHLNTHLLFYIETIVESIPQSIIQLLAVTFLGQATPLQVFSMSLSLISIVSKGYVLSMSYTITAVVFKFCVAAHDIFSLFFVFSTLLSKDAPKEIQVFDSGVWFTYMSYIWLFKEVVLIAYATLALMVLGITVTIGEVLRHGCRRETVGYFFLSIAGYCLLSIPIAIALEGGKLLWLVGWISSWEPERQDFPAFGQLYSFLHSGKDYSQRMQFTTLLFCEESDKVQLRRLQSNNNSGQLPSSAPAGRRRQRSKIPTTFLSTVQEHARHPEYHPSRNWRWHIFDGGSKFRCRLTLECLLQVSFTIFTILYVLSQTFSFVFPWVVFIREYQTQNLLQRFCFWAMCVPLLFAIPLIPCACRYMRLNLDSWFIRANHIDMSVGSFVTRLLSEFHIPPYAQIIQNSIPEHLVPYDVANYLTQFMKPADVDMSQLSIDECRQLREEYVDGVHAVVKRFQCHDNDNEEEEEEDVEFVEEREDIDL